MKTRCTCGRGRPLKVTRETVNLLREAFRVGCTDEEATAYAGISPRALYYYMKKYPEFREERERLKQLPTIWARHNVVQAISKGDINRSQWYLERKMKNEFASRTELSPPQESTEDALDIIAYATGKPAQIEPAVPGERAGQSEDRALPDPAEDFPDDFDAVPPSEPSDITDAVWQEHDRRLGDLAESDASA
ncbi:MAG: hypothetical protein Q8Q08_12765 [Candidatus Omnitrophota bacterium]|nr:hypothetical protein [Candidatus Omnitrophota bacterium]